MTLHTALLQGRRLLEQAEVPVPRLTAEVLLAHALGGRERSWLYAHSDEELSEVAWIHYGRYVHERTQGKPTQYITGKQEFYGRDFAVSPDVLIPRPETEHLVETMIPLLKGRSPAARVVDVGTGSGAIAVSLQLEAGCRMWAVDISPAALGVARRNATNLGARVEAFLCCDLLSGLAPGSMDAIVSNPPYVPSTDDSAIQREVRDWEPHVALFGGELGTEMYLRLIDEAPRVLRPGGWLTVELGFRCLDAVRSMLVVRGWSEIEVVEDLAGLPRVLRTRYWPPGVRSAQSAALS